MHIIKERISIGATSSSGTLTGNSSYAYSGIVYAVSRVVASASTEYGTGCTFTVATRTNGLAVLTAVVGTTGTVTYYPRATAVTTTGAALSTTVAMGIPLYHEGVTITISSAQKDSSGHFDLYIQGGIG
jgi:hypothetical protein